MFLQENSPLIDKEGWIWDSSHHPCNVLVRETHDRKHLERWEMV